MAASSESAPYLGFGSPESSLGSKIGLDATNKPETKREWGRRITIDPTVVEAVTKKWGRPGLPWSAEDAARRGKDAQLLRRRSVAATIAGSDWGW